MFKCKQCGREVGANTPQVCPDCGAAIQQPVTDARGVTSLLAIETIGTLAALILIVLAIVWIAGWF